MCRHGHFNIGNLRCPQCEASRLRAVAVRKSRAVNPVARKPTPRDVLVREFTPTAPTAAAPGEPARRTSGRARGKVNYALLQAGPRLPTAASDLYCGYTSESDGGEEEGGEGEEEERGNRMANGEGEVDEPGGDHGGDDEEYEEEEEEEYDDREEDEEGEFD